MIGGTIMRNIIIAVAVAGLAAAGSTHAFAKAECNPQDRDPNTCAAIWQAIGLPDGSSAGAAGGREAGDSNSDDDVAHDRPPIMQDYVCTQ